MQYRVVEKPWQPFGAQFVVESAITSDGHVVGWAPESEHTSEGAALNDMALRVAGPRVVATSSTESEGCGQERGTGQPVLS